MKKLFSVFLLAALASVIGGCATRTPLAEPGPVIVTDTHTVTAADGTTTTEVVKHEESRAAAEERITLAKIDASIILSPGGAYGFRYAETPAVGYGVGAGAGEYSYRYVPVDTGSYRTPPPGRSYRNNR